MDQAIIIQKTVDFIKDTLSNAESGHDFWHTYRVWNTAKYIAKYEKVDNFIIELGALLHDVADSKFYNGDETIGPQKAGDFLNSIKVDPVIITHIQNIIIHISFKNEKDVPEFNSPELKVIQDADRLDAIGAIGIARAFNYGGYKNRAIYDPDSKPNIYLTKEEYKNSNSSTINHFYEKLLLLKDKMNTKTGKSLAIQRHNFMIQFLEQFYKESSCSDFE